MLSSGEMLRQACVSVGAALVPAAPPSVRAAAANHRQGAEIEGPERHLVGSTKVFGGTELLVAIVSSLCVVLDFHVGILKVLSHAAKFLV